MPLDLYLAFVAATAVSILIPGPAVRCAIAIQTVSKAAITISLTTVG